MGEHADDMIDGTTCSHCGCFFQDPENPEQCYTHEYPVLCKECYDDETAGERAGLPRATADSL